MSLTTFISKVTNLAVKPSKIKKSTFKLNVDLGDKSKHKSRTPKLLEVASKEEKVRVYKRQLFL